ncbi:hypothetical protein M153_1834000500, partial [Pseudoloma neurophilia]
MLFLYILSLISIIRAESDTKEADSNKANSNTVDEQYSGQLIKNLSFKRSGNDVIITVYLAHSCNPQSINLMSSKSGDQDSFTIDRPIEDDVTWVSDKNRFTYECDTSTLNDGNQYAIQIQEKSGKFSHSEPFVLQEKEFIFARNAKKSAPKAGWIVALVLSGVALL